jgi:prepilin-type N-terminal cleavage/methylation domain-containing protein
MQTQNQRGFSLIEVMFSLGILTAGVLGAASVLAAGMKNLSSSPGDVIVTQKAAEAIEGVFAARDSHKVEWAKVRNVHGETGADGGIFLDGPQPLHGSGSDGLMNTADDASQPLEEVPLPGADGIFNTADDISQQLVGFSREIEIKDIPGTGGQLRSVTVTMTYKHGQSERKYTLTTYISVYA